MRHILIAAFAALLCACAQPRGDFDESGVRAANAAYDQALIAADAAALDGIYADDFGFIGANAERRDKAEQIAFMTNGGIGLLEAASDEVSVTPLGAAHALVTGRFRGHYRNNETDVHFTERYTSVWSREDGRWRLRHEHSSFEPGD